MAVVPIRILGDPVLHTPTSPVPVGPDGSLPADLPELIATLYDTMEAADGVGLAANQIGVGLRVFVYDCPDAADTAQAGYVINPVLRIPGALAPPVTQSEGCLSVPGQHADIPRPALATVTGQDLDGGEVVVTGTGLLARCLQHEADHLDGIVYVDKLPAAQRAALLAAAARRIAGG